MTKTTKNIVLYGGSFNPPTLAHRAVGLCLRDHLPVDAVWFLVSPQNPFKSTQGMASFADRVAMTAQTIAGDAGLIATDIEGRYAGADNRAETAETLRRLTLDFPTTRFIWAMGADNFPLFDRWHNAAAIEARHPLVLIPRAGHDDALNCANARRIPRLHSPDQILTETGWLALPAVADTISATACRAELARGIAPAAMRPEVARYALTHRLYAPP